jgi:hypothetical protein
MYRRQNWELMVAIWERLAQQQGSGLSIRSGTDAPAQKLDRDQSAHRQRERRLRAKLSR